MITLPATGRLLKNDPSKATKKRETGIEKTDRLLYVPECHLMQVKAA